MTTYRVVIVGLKTGHDADEVVRRLAAMFNQPVERLRALVAGSRTVVKRGADMALAARMQAAIEGAGCEVVVEPEVGEVLPASAQSTIHAANTNAEAIVASPSLLRSKTVRYGGGLLLLCLAFGIAGAIYSFLQDRQSSAPVAVHEQKTSPPTSSALRPTTAPTPAAAASVPRKSTLVGTWVCRDTNTNLPNLKTFSQVTYGPDGTYRSISPAMKSYPKTDVSGRYELAGSQLHVVLDRLQVADMPADNRRWEQVFEVKAGSDALNRILVAKKNADTSEWTKWPVESPRFLDECVREGTPVPDSWESVDTPRGFLLAMRALKAKCQLNGNLGCAVTCSKLENQALQQLGRFNQILTGDPTEIPASYPPQFPVASMLENFHRLCERMAGGR